MTGLGLHLIYVFIAVVIEIYPCSLAFGPWEVIFEILLSISVFILLLKKLDRTSTFLGLDWNLPNVFMKIEEYFLIEQCQVENGFSIIAGRWQMRRTFHLVVYLLWSVVSGEDSFLF